MMQPVQAVLLTTTPIVSAMVQAAIPVGHEAASYWVSYGSFAILAWAAYGMLNKAWKQAAEERQASEERMAALVQKVLDNESRGHDVMAEYSQQLGELTGVIRRCSSQPVNVQKGSDT